jgi:hypothetical protein
MPEQVYTTSEAAEILGVTVGTIHFWLNTVRKNGRGKRLEGYQLSGEPGSPWRVYKRSVDALLARRKAGKTGPLDR